MTDKYVPAEIEPKWQRWWEEEGLYRSDVDPTKRKYYALTMLPYPSGDLHIGHWYAMSPSDARARYLRMRGYNVLFPMGFDAFGLPAENAAIQRGIHPRTWTMSNVENMRKQLRSMGAMFDWRREAVTCLPGYYRWSQWFFLRMYEMGLAYRAFAPVDFCPHCNTTLAREQVWGEDRHCERCGTAVIKKELNQWFFRITAYADELLDFSQIDWPDRVKTMQENWIGRSEGAQVTFLAESGEAFEIFTTRPDTLWGATFMVLAPEHPLVDALTTEEQREAVQAYKFQAARQSEIERVAVDREKTGVFIGAFAINPVNGARIPIWIADYVMMTYGTGAIMAVPAHDERDFDFAIKFGLPIIPVIDRTDGAAKSIVYPGAVSDLGALARALAQAGIAVDRKPVEGGGEGLYVTLEGRAQCEAYLVLVSGTVTPGHWVEVVGGRWAFAFPDGIVEFGSVEADQLILARCKATSEWARPFRTTMEMLSSKPFYEDVLFHAEYGTMINSNEFSGTPGDVAKHKVTEWLHERGVGSFAVNYRLHDWLISRQRYWGTPIPMVYCEQCGVVPVPYADLPVVLPEDAEIPKSGENALKYHEGFLNTTCPRCGGPATRETDTMDTFMCSSWYQYAYLSPYYKEGTPAAEDSMPFDPAEGAYWLPVDQYTGGIEHATMHLIYTRFFTKAMRDMGIVDFGEPMLALYNQGMVLGEDGEKMSKSRGNVIAPDDLVRQYGADVVRTYLMFFARWDLGGPWDSQGIRGSQRFVEDVWNLVVEPLPAATGDAAPEDVRALRRIVHQSIQKVTEDIEAFGFNTAIAQLMTLRNALKAAKETPVARSPAWDEAIEALLLLSAPFTPHIAEELWRRIGRESSIHLQSWPEWDPEIAAEELITLIVQVNGRVRDRIEVPAGIDDAEAERLALASDGVQRHAAGKRIVKVVVVPGRLVNVVAR
ncbi:MAG: leucine--tRNA ligase [Anaerolineae bacterium]|nr:leucine--tRNA ligase [Anaerolineae bacterium]